MSSVFIELKDKTYDGNLIYEFAANWGVTKLGEILRFNSSTQRWQMSNRALVCINKTINDNTPKNEILNNIVDITNLNVDGCKIDLIGFSINDSRFEFDTTSERQKDDEHELIFYRGWVLDLDAPEVLEQGEKCAIKEINALIKAFDYRDIAKTSFVSKDYFASIEKDENYLAKINGEKGGTISQLYFKRREYEKKFTCDKG